MATIKTDLYRFDEQQPTTVSSVSRSLPRGCRVRISSFSSLFGFQRVLRAYENDRFFVFVLDTTALTSGFLKGHDDVVIIVDGGNLAVWFPKSHYLNDMPL